MNTAHQQTHPSVNIPRYRARTHGMWTDLTFNLILLLMSDYPRAPPRSDESTVMPFAKAP